MAKRKREDATQQAIAPPKSRKHESSSSADVTHNPPSAQTSDHTKHDAVTIQIVTGSYERVLHGIQATIPSIKANTASTTEANDISANEASTNESTAQFTDTFLFAAHSSAIRCLALSPASKGTRHNPPGVILASGSTDERVHLYHLSTTPSPPTPTNGTTNPPLPSLNGHASAENPRNRELGSLLHHSSSVGGLHFPSRAKLLTAADDNTIAFVRVRDWTVLSTLRAPVPKPVGRPSGDTAAPGEVPAGVNDFAVHPSSKLMVSVGRGERCMRLWNLVTGKKAGVLNFDREVLRRVGESKWSTGEGRKVEWNESGTEFVVGFERGALVYDMDSKPKALLVPQPPTKVHQIKYVEGLGEVVALSTEDGRIIFFNTSSTNDEPAESTDGATSNPDFVPHARPVAQLGGKAVGLSGRIKDFEMLQIPEDDDSLDPSPLLLVTGSSDGAVRMWSLPVKDLEPGSESQSEQQAVNVQVGELLGTYETGNRITCLRAFVMDRSTHATDRVDGDIAEDRQNAFSSDDSD